MRMYFYCNCNVCSNRHDYANILNIKRKLILDTRYNVSKFLIFIYIINYIYKYYFHVQVLVTARCACPFLLK